MDRRTFLATCLAGCGGGSEVEYELQPSPRTNARSVDPLKISKKWTPAINFVGTNGNITYANQQGLYVRDVNLVWIAFELELSSKGTVSGIPPKLATLTGLPYPVASTDSANVPLVNIGLIMWENMTTSLINMTGTVTFNGQIISLQGITAASTTLNTALVWSDFADNTKLRGQFSYFV